MLVSNRIEYRSNYSIGFEISNIRTELIETNELTTTLIHHHKDDDDNDDSEINNSLQLTSASAQRPLRYILDREDGQQHSV